MPEEVELMYDSEPVIQDKFRIKNVEPINFTKYTIDGEPAEQIPLQIYARIDAKALLGTLQSDKWGKLKKRLQDRISQEFSRTVEEYDFPKLTAFKAGNVRIKDNPPLIYHHPLLDALKYRQVIIDATNQYRNTLTNGHNALLDHYEIKDIAVKVVGIGSIGTLCAIALLMSQTTMCFSFR